MTDQDNQSDSLAGDGGTGSSDGSGNVADSNLTLEELNSTLGRNYKDKPTALKALKDTYSMVGKAGKLEQQNKTLVDQLNNANNGATDEKLRNIEAELFFSNNPQYKPYRDTIAAMGGIPAEVVEKEAFKKVFEGLSELEKTKSAKSVLESNPRIGQAKTKIDEAKEMVNKGQYARSKEIAVDAVLQAYES